MKTIDSIYTAITGKTIGLSISESQDLAKLGFGQAHLEDAKIEIARHLISCGASLMYGGDLRDDGYTRKLFDVVENYKLTKIPQEQRVLTNVLGWPIQITLSNEVRASLSDRIAFEETGLPDDLPQTLSAKKHLKPVTVKEFYVWNRTMSRMRTFMTGENDARIALGGKTVGFKGKYPGIVEETYLSIKAGKPTFLIGAFGGATQDVIEALEGENPERLTSEYQFQSGQTKAIAEYYNTKKPTSEEAIDYETLVDFFNKKGVESLNNGLSEKENQRLFETIHLPEMVSLILKGLVSTYG